MNANQTMSRKALNSEAIQARMLSVLLGPAGLWEGLRQVGATALTVSDQAMAS